MRRCLVPRDPARESQRQELRGGLSNPHRRPRTCPRVLLAGMFLPGAALLRTRQFLQGSCGNDGGGSSRETNPNGAKRLAIPGMI